MRRLSALLLLTQASAYNVGDVEHFLVLFMEDRSFDNLFGCSGLPGVDGIEAGMGNWIDPSDHSKGFVNVTCGTAQYVSQRDEDHSFNSSTFQIFGANATSGATAPYPKATMSGFANLSHGGAMRAFAPHQLPVKMALAKEFGLFNNLYASVPGPSQPNHMFAQSATACGVTATGVGYDECGGILPLFPQKTIYDSLLEASKDFAVFSNGSLAEGGLPGDIYLSGLLRHLNGRLHTYDAPEVGLFARAASGTLPAFSWLVPRSVGPRPNDDHPCHDVALGEELLKGVYEALRAEHAHMPPRMHVLPLTRVHCAWGGVHGTYRYEALRAGPKWNQTALLVGYAITSIALRTEARCGLAPVVTGARNCCCSCCGAGTNSTTAR